MGSMVLSRGARPPRGGRLGFVARALVGALVLTVAGLWGLSTGTAFAVNVPFDLSLGGHTFPFELVLASTNEPLHPEGMSVAVTVVVDSTPPVISLTAPAAGSTSTSGAITLSGTAGTATADSATVT